MEFPDHNCDVIVTWTHNEKTITEACLYVSDGGPIIAFPPLGLDLHFDFVLKCPDDKVFFEDEEGLFALFKRKIFKRLK
jgi:hypothetical protein